MKSDSPRWHVVARTPHAHEQLGLDLIRECLPDQSPYQGWANFEFMADNGQLYEVDSLVLTPKGFFLIELKHWQGDVSGDPYTWERTVNGKTWAEDSPYPGINNKAKRFKSLLGSVAGRNARQRVPWVQPLVVLSNKDQRVRLTKPARIGIAGPDGSVMVTKDGLDPVGELLASLERGPHGEKPRMYPPQVLADAARLIEKAGIKARVASRRVGDFELVESLEDSDFYQDYSARHHRTETQQRRIRIYSFAKSSTEEERARNLRAADREFELFAGADHPGIESPTNRVDHERGPCLVFPFDPKSSRIDHWLREHDTALSLPQRLLLVRRLAEALAFAHNRRVFHRALDPQAVWVSGSPEDPRLRVRNWQSAVRLDAANGKTVMPTRASRAATGLDLLSDIAQRYQAPELRADPRAKPRACDIFSLGALSFLIFSGTDPATSVAKLDEQLRITGALSLDNVVDGVDEKLHELVWFATSADPSTRYKTVGDLLAQLDEVEATARPLVEEPTEGIDPLRAVKDDLIEDRFLVEAVLGTGATARALLVSDLEANDATRVLKVALDDERATQLHDEAETLQRLSHPRVVRLLADPLVIGNHTALLMARAGVSTLSDRLHKDGPPGLEFLERWGADLLEAVAYLESQGIAHRDIKPANIGVAKQGANDELHLVLFDFSLTKVPAHRIEVGTTGYVDPFLRSEGRGRWDSHAERFAAAVTMYQMTTGELPVWGEPGTDPLMTAQEVTLDTTRFDPALAGGLVKFFAKCLARVVNDRFGSAAEMLEAWRACFREAAEPPAQGLAGTEATDRRTRQPPPSPSTSVADLRLSARAVNALEKAGVVTAGDLLAVNPVALNRMRGVGKKTVAEIKGVQIQLRAELRASDRGTSREASDGADTAAPPTSTGTDVSTDRIVNDLLSQADSARDHRIASVYLGIEAPADTPPLPNQASVARAVSTDQATVSRVLGGLRPAWADQPSLATVRDQVADALRQAGVLGASQLAELLLTLRGSTADEPDRSRRGLAVVRAALETEAFQLEPRWVLRRSGDRLIAADTGAGDEGANPEELLTWAVRLGARAEELAATDPPLPPDRVRDALVAIEPPAGAPGSDDRALLELAAAAAQSAALSARGELYIRGLAPQEAIRRATGSLLGTTRLTRDQLAARLRARFPEMAPLPDDASVIGPMLAAAGLDLRWDTSESAWLPPTGGPARSFTRASTSTTSAGVVSPDSFESRLAQSLDSGRLLVLTCRPRRYLHALRQLEKRDVTVVDVDERLLHHLSAQASELEIGWSTILDADGADTGDTDWRNLNQLVDQAIDGLTDELIATDGTVLLVNLGLLRRYGHLNLLDNLRTAIQQQRVQLRSVWALVATDTPDSAAVDGEPIALVDRSEKATIPSRWLEAPTAA